MKTWDRFWCGALAHAATISILQDYWGKGRYIAIVEAAWVSWKITLPLAIAALVLAIVKAEHRKGTTTNINIHRDGVVDVEEKETT